jgi:hypothetical protein
LLGASNRDLDPPVNNQTPPVKPASKTKYIALGCGCLSVLVFCCFAGGAFKFWGEIRDTFWEQSYRYVDSVIPEPYGDDSFTFDGGSAVSWATISCRAGSTYLLRGSATMSDGSGTPRMLLSTGACPEDSYHYDAPGLALYRATRVTGTLTVTSPSGDTSEKGQILFWEEH